MLALQLCYQGLVSRNDGHYTKPLPLVCLDRAITNELRLQMACRPPRHDHGGIPLFQKI